MKECTVALFGEAEKGEFRTAYFCQTLPQLEENFGHPPPHSRGLHYAIQTLLLDYNLIFFRVLEEGFSTQDYILGLRFLENSHFVSNLTAVCLPGVGSTPILDATQEVCSIHKSLLISSESDLYDYLTLRPVLQ
jgi:hypothetical protein